MEDRRLEDLEDKLNTVQEKVDDVDKKLDQVLTALMGSELSLNKGLVHEIREMRTRILKLENLKNKVIWTSLGAGVGGGMGLATIIKWIQEAAK